MIIGIAFFTGSGPENRQSPSIIIILIPAMSLRRGVGLYLENGRVKPPVIKSQEFI